MAMGAGTVGKVRRPQNGSRVAHIKRRLPSQALPAGTFINDGQIPAIRSAMPAAMASVPEGLNLQVKHSAPIPCDELDLRHSRAMRARAQSYGGGAAGD